MRTVSSIRGFAVTIAIIGVAILTGSCADADSSPAAANLTGSPSQPSDTSARILEAVDSPRLTRVDVKGPIAEVTGQAALTPGDASRTLWYATVAGTALAQAQGLESIERIVLDPSGSELDSERDPLTALTNDAGPFAPLTLSSSDIQSQVDSEAASLGVTILDVHYVALYGGTAEIVVQPNDVVKFVGSAGSDVNTLLGSLGQDRHPYLVTIVDGEGAPQLLLSFVAGIGGTNGQGMAWAAPGVQTDAILGMPQVDS